MHVCHGLLVATGSMSLKVQYHTLLTSLSAVLPNLHIIFIAVCILGHSNNTNKCFQCVP